MKITLIIKASRLFCALIAAAQSASMSTSDAKRRSNAAVKQLTGVDVLGLLEISPARQLDAGGNVAPTIDSANTFLNSWAAGSISFAPFIPCRSRDLYACYTLWCQSNRHVPIPVTQFTARAARSTGVRKIRARAFENRNKSGSTTTRRMLVPVKAAPPPGIDASEWRTDCIFEFSDALAGARHTLRGAGDE